MKPKGKNKYGLKLEDFDSYKDYRRAYNRIIQNNYYHNGKGKLRNSKYEKSEKAKLTRFKYSRSERGKLVGRIKTSKRRSAKLQRTVAWSNLDEIANFYKACPKGHQVDHIIPLQGKNVSGLHVLNNLQYLTPSENSSKGNRYYEHQ